MYAPFLQGFYAKLTQPTGSKTYHIKKLVRCLPHYYSLDMHLKPRNDQDHHQFPQVFLSAMSLRLLEMMDTQGTG